MHLALQLSESRKIHRIAEIAVWIRCFVLQLATESVQQPKFSAGLLRLFDGFSSGSAGFPRVLYVSRKNPYDCARFLYNAPANPADLEDKPTDWHGIPTEWHGNPADRHEKPTDRHENPTDWHENPSDTLRDPLDILRCCMDSPPIGRIRPPSLRHAGVSQRKPDASGMHR